MGKTLVKEILFLPDGMNSGVNSEFLSDTQYFNGMNIVCRGGMPQTRPGYKTIFGLPCGQPQFLTMFKPTNNRQFLVFGVNGLVYKSEAPFRTFDLLPNIRFSERAKFVAHATTVQSSFIDETGQFKYLNRTKSVLIMQDGLGPPAFWDGTESGHILGENISGCGEDGTFTPKGLWMAWVGNRLWVSRDNQVFASDFGNPLRFTEDTYLNEGRSFYMPEDVTGMVQPTSESPLLVFGANSTTRLRADIDDRNQWLSTPEFQRTDFNIGCLSHRSIIKSFGQTWWYSRLGVVNLDSASQLFVSSKFRPLDNHMSISKANLSPVKDIIAGASFENYLMWSTPSGDVNNRDTWVLDQLTTPDGGPAWNSVWTGTRPVEWTTGIVDQEDRIFHLSVDYDGVNRIWEAFQADRTDNGCAITCSLELGLENFNTSTRKRFSYAEMLLDELVGQTDMAVWVAGRKGPYNKIMEKRMQTKIGPFDSVREYTPETQLTDYKPQTRTIKTQSLDVPDNACNFCPVESDFDATVDTSFSLLMVWSGRLGVRGVRLVAEDQGDDVIRGDCEDNETAENIVTIEGCGVKDEDVIPSAFPEFTDAETVTLSCENDEYEYVIGSAIAESVISELDANKKAICAAEQDALSFLNTCS